MRFRCSNYAPGVRGEKLLDPFWIGVVGTLIALAIIGKAMLTMRGQQKGRGLMLMYTIMAAMFIGVIWFIILKLMPAA